MQKIEIRNLKILFLASVMLAGTFSFQSMPKIAGANQALTNNEKSMTVEYKFINDSLVLENGYVYLRLSQLNVSIDVLKFDPEGSGNYGKNVLAQSPINNGTKGMSSLYYAEDSRGIFESFSSINDANGATVNIGKELDKVVAYLSDIEISNRAGQAIGEEEWILTLEEGSNFFEIERNFIFYNSVNLTNFVVFQGFFNESYDAAILKAADDGCPLFYFDADKPPYIYQWSGSNTTMNDHGTGKIARTTGSNTTLLDHTMTLFNNTYWNGTVYLDFENDFPPLFVHVKEWQLYDARFQFMITNTSVGTPTFNVGWILSAKRLFEAKTYFGGKLEIGFFNDGLLNEVMPFGLRNAPEWLITLQWKLYFSILVSMNGKGLILPDALNYKETYVRDAVGALLGYFYTSDTRGVQFASDFLGEIKKRQTIDGIVPTSFTDYLDWKNVTFTSALDVQAWYVILAWQYYAATQDQQFVQNFASSLRMAVNVLIRNDIDGNGLINASPGNPSDWADTIKRTGEPLFLNSLAYWVFQCMAELELALANSTGYYFYAEWQNRVGFELNKDLVDGGLWNSTGNYYSAWKFENGTVRAYFEIDSNLLAVYSGVANKSRAENIFHIIDQNQELWENAPSRVLLELYDPRDISVPKWNFPGTYHNGGNWLWIGGYDVLARASSNQTIEAVSVLQKIRSAVFRNASIYEWYDSQGFGRWGQSTCEWFSWSAGTVLYSIFRGLLGIELEPNGLIIRGELPASLENVSVRLLFRQTDFTINYYGYGSYISKMTVDEELVNSRVIPTKYYDGNSHVLDVYITASPPRDCAYLRDTVLQVLSSSFSDTCLNITFVPVNFTDTIEIYVPWNDSFTMVRFENGSFSNWEIMEQTVKIVLNPSEIGSIGILHGHSFSEKLAFWTSIDVSIVDASFEKSEMFMLHADIQFEGPVFLKVYAPEYGKPTRVGISGNLFTKPCEDAEMLELVSYDCWNLNEVDHVLRIKTFSLGPTSIVVRWGFALPEMLPLLLTAAYLMFVTGIFMLIVALLVFWAFPKVIASLRICVLGVPVNTH